MFTLYCLYLVLSLLSGYGYIPERPEYGSKAWLVVTTQQAEQGDADAQYSLGTYYYSDPYNQHEYGALTSKELEEGAKWSLKAAEQGHFMAQYDLMVRYDHGIGVPQDDTEMVKWARKVVEHEHTREEYPRAEYQATAQFLLGDRYFRGIGVPEDKAEAAKWFRKVKESGHGYHSADAARLLQDIEEETF